MIAYNKDWLNANIALDEIENAFAKSNISQEERDAAAAQFKTGFYTPNIYIRVGLILLTLIIVSFSSAVLALFFISTDIDIERSAAILGIFFGVGCHVALELFVKKKHHHQSGVDDALLWIGAIYFVTGSYFLFNLSTLGTAILICILSLYCTLRFADRLMAAVTALALLGMIFFAVLRIGSSAKFIMPFVLMFVSALIYFSSKKITSILANRYYKNCLLVTSIVGLACAYLAGNYFVVREASVEFFDMSLTKNETVPFGWLFWLFSFAIPLLYIFAGVKRKDLVLIRVGLLLVAGIVFTVRYYYHMVPLEISMIIGGIMMIGIAYILLKYLKIPRKGFTAIAEMNARRSNNLEALIIAETLSAPQQSPSGTQFGGGDFGGGGASGEY